MILSCKEDPRLSEFLTPDLQDYYVCLYVEYGAGRWLTDEEKTSWSVFFHRRRFMWSLETWALRNDKGQKLDDFLRENYPEALL